MTTFTHPELDRQIDSEATIMTAPVAIIHGYIETKREGSDVLILSDYALYEEDIPLIVAWLREYDIDRVALTTGSSALKRILWAFWQAGCVFTMREAPGGRYVTIVHV